VEGANVGYVRGLMPRSSWGIDAAVAEATAVVILNRTQSRARWKLWGLLFLIPGRQNRVKDILAERDDHSLGGGNCWADGVKSRCRTSDQGTSAGNGGLFGSMQRQRRPR
jgi:hypothetical protein